MKTYIAQRLGIGLVTLFGMSVVIFLLLRLAPGNIVDILFSTGGYVNPSERAAIERELGLDKPLWAQYVEWMGQLAVGNLGKSYRYDLPAWEIIRPLIPVTLELAAAVDASLVSWIAEVLRARGAERLEVTANPHAMAFYRSAGFIDCGVAETNFGTAPRLDHLRARWEKLVSIVDATNLHFDATEAGVPNGGAILVRPDGFIGFRAAPANETTMDALDTHLATYLVPGFHQAV